MQHVICPYCGKDAEYVDSSVIFPSPFKKAQDALSSVLRLRCLIPPAF